VVILVGLTILRTVRWISVGLTILRIGDGYLGGPHYLRDRSAPPYSFHLADGGGKSRAS
jgi:hypothetical protein